MAMRATDELKNMVVDGLDKMADMMDMVYM